MHRWTLIVATTLSLAGLLLFACTSAEKRYTLPDQHPEEIASKGRPNCLDCHERDDGVIVYADFVHTPDFTKLHRFQAYQNPKVCAMCHQQSFCNECHVTRVELKPSILRQTDTYRRLPHRGDYLSRHRIDGRLDPTSCFRCHGNPKSSKNCNPCHG
jgi:hypothetical protein